MIVAPVPQDDDPAPEPDPSTVPTDDQSKDEIIAWLAAQGVEVTKKVKSKLTKAELLDLVQDVIDDERD